jgi:hypothetical protein
MPKSPVFIFLFVWLLICPVLIRAEQIPVQSSPEYLSILVLDDIRKVTVERAGKMLHEKPVTVNTGRRRPFTKKL